MWNRRENVFWLIFLPMKWTPVHSFQIQRYRGNGKRHFFLYSFLTFSLKWFIKCLKGIVDKLMLKLIVTGSKMFCLTQKEWKYCYIVYRVGFIGVYFFDSFYWTYVSTALGNQLDSTEKKNWLLLCHKLAHLFHLYLWVRQVAADCLHHLWEINLILKTCRLCCWVQRGHAVLRINHGMFGYTCPHLSNKHRNQQIQM